MTDSDLGDFSEFGGDGEGDVEADRAGDARDADAGADTDTGTASESFERVAYEGGGGDGLGVLAVSEGLRIGEREDETRLRAYVTSANRSNVRLGRYLVAPYPDGESLFCKIVGLEYGRRFHGDDANEIHARRAMQSGDIDEDDYRFVADLEPVSVLYRDDGELKRRMPDRVPKPETVVREADDDAEIKTALKIPDAGVFVGHLAVGGEKVRTGATPPTIDYRVKDDYATGDPLAFRHTLVAGGTGSGKTHTAKNVLRQYLSEDRTYPVEAGSDREVQAAVVQFDPQDEYAQMHDDNPEADREDERRWEREGIAHGGHDDTVAFVPKVGNATYTAAHHGADQVPFTIPFSMARSRPWLAASAGLNDNQYPALQDLLRRFFDQYGDGGTYREFCAFLDDPALKEELDESGKVHEATYEAVFRRVRGVPDGVFDQDARPITDLVEQFVKPGRLSVVPTYHVSDSRATETVVLALASLLVDEKLSSDPRHPRIAETPLVVGMDEAHNFLADADTVQARHVVAKFTDAAKQGRKERLGLFLITQDPQDVAESVFKQINTKVVLNLGDEDAIKSVNIPASLAEKVPYMETGQMVVYSPDNSEPVELVGLPTCLTRHGRD
ncbi:ATP-binding protein [Halarchaeum sp. CBA1220]|uniref:ATP-binding protein n=1 Tax=Halarchaeum sp. CBA1220 TaxID=1853682 RepID=UPI000F3AA4E7|nr:ATP-binding protein [Halarchaeum sp. CBA1220]QLC33027.1 ATP-binding protein [Halarchaeum sp. CBA1220]